MEHTKIAEEMKKIAKDDRINCGEALKLAEDLKVSPGEVGKTANELKIKIKNCSLGCFK
jgi:LAO/AO transport system kinase